MKRSRTAPLLLALALLAAEARPEAVTLTFNAEWNGTPVQLDSILVTDLIQGQDTMLYYPDTVLVLDLSTGIGELAGEERGIALCQNRPNPYGEFTAVELLLAEGGQVQLGVTDAMGRDMVGWRGRLLPGTHRFMCTGGVGTQVLWAASNGRRAALRMVGVGGNGAASLAYCGMGSAGLTRSLSAWAAGDSLRMTGYATLGGVLVVGASIFAAPAASDTYTFSFGTILGCDGGISSVTDIDGHNYPLVTIGGQCWMAENLRTTRYRNSDFIPNIEDSTAWAQLSTGAWCNYENNVGYDSVFGKLYNWYAATDARGVCPSGWHVPTDVEWQQMEGALGMPADDVVLPGDRGILQNIGGQLKSITWWDSPNVGANNSSGFSGLPGAMRYHNGNFGSLGSSGAWWTASDEGPETTWYRSFYSSGRGIIRFFLPKYYGLSLRCVRD